MLLTARTVLNLSLTPALLCDQELTILDFNQLFEEVSGYTKDARNNLCLKDIYQGHDLHQLTAKLSQGIVYFSHFKFRDSKGTLYPGKINMVSLDNQQCLLTFQIASPNEHNNVEQDQQLGYDPLTALPNRHILHKRIRTAVKDCRKQATHAAIIFVDLDEFKPINDSFGHACGDHTLIKTAERMLKQIRSHDIVARIGGDEFVLVCTDIQKPVHAGLTAKRLIRSITRPIKWQDNSVQVSASVGIAIAPENGEDPEELIHKADEAMYLAKKSGKNGYSFFDEDNYFL